MKQPWEIKNTFVLQFALCADPGDIMTAAWRRLMVPVDSLDEAVLERLFRALTAWVAMPFQPETLNCANASRTYPIKVEKVVEHEVAKVLVEIDRDSTLFSRAVSVAELLAIIATQRLKRRPSATVFATHQEACRAAVLPDAEAFVHGRLDVAPSAALVQELARLRVSPRVRALEAIDVLFGPPSAGTCE